MSDDFTTDISSDAMWAPLLAIADQLHGELPSFMFMGFEPSCGRFHYKHSDTRRYLIITGHGAAYHRGCRVPLELAIRYALGLDEPTDTPW